MKVVMLVEDDEEAREALGDLLEDAGYAVVLAENGSAAWKLLEQPGQSCDVILLDLMMPIMNGWDFRRRQRADPRFASIPVLVMSAGAHMASVADELGTAGYLPKPIEIGVLLEMLQRHCP
jgi:CheY-like chemotaxis protein